MVRTFHVALLAAYLVALYCWHLLLGSFFVPSPSQLPLPTKTPTGTKPRVESVRSKAVKPLPLSPSPPPQPPPPPPPPPKKSLEDKAQCQGHVHTEYDGAVMVPGTGVGATVSKSPADCCRLCQTTRGCNIWVACTDAWCGDQCWLKWVEDPSKPLTRAVGGTTPWTSGALMKDCPKSQPVPSNASLDAVRVVALKTSAGEIRIRLKPEWHLPSVRFVQAAALGDFCTVKCEFYRAEPGFLFQGAMRALVEPNKHCRAFPGGPAECTDPEERPGGPIMEQFDVAWAGGSNGPDFFIMVVRSNGFGASHTVWGTLADESSKQLVLKLVRGPSKSAPGTMRMLDDPVRFTISPSEEPNLS